VPIVLKSGSLKLLETSGPLQACNGIALPLSSLAHHSYMCFCNTGRKTYVMNPLGPNDIYIYMCVCVCERERERECIYIYICICRTAQLTSRRFILNIYSTNILTEYFKQAAHSPFLSLQDAVYFIMLPFMVPVIFTFEIQDVL
jgi:hypothetical protein